METQLNQEGLTQVEIGNLAGGLIWCQYPGILYYESASNVVKALGILVLIYAVYLIIQKLTKKTICNRGASIILNGDTQFLTFL
jgi:hypothetical protein